MKLLPKSEISFELTKEELIKTKHIPKSEYNWWLKFMRVEQKIYTLLSTEKYLAIRKCLVLDQMDSFLNFDWLFCKL